MLPDSTRHRTRTRACLLLVLLCCVAATAAPTAEPADAEPVDDVPANLTIVFGLSRDGLAYRILQAILPYLQERFDSVTVSCLCHNSPTHWRGGKKNTSTPQKHFFPHPPFPLPHPTHILLHC